MIIMNIISLKHDDVISPTWLPVEGDKSPLKPYKTSFSISTNNTNNTIYPS